VRLVRNIIFGKWNKMLREAKPEFAPAATALDQAQQSNSNPPRVEPYT